MCQETAKIVLMPDNVWTAEGCLMEYTLDVSDNPKAGINTIIKDMKPKCSCGHIFGTVDARDTGEAEETSDQSLWNSDT